MSDYEHDFGSPRAIRPSSKPVPTDDEMVALGWRWDDVANKWVAGDEGEDA